MTIKDLIQEQDKSSTIDIHKLDPDFEKDEKDRLPYIIVTPKQYEKCNDPIQKNVMYPLDIYNEENIDLFLKCKDTGERDIRTKEILRFIVREFDELVADRFFNYMRDKHRFPKKTLEYIYNKIKKKENEKEEQKGGVVYNTFDKLSNAKRFIKNNPLYYDNSKLWWKWTGIKWEKIDETDILNSYDEHSLGLEQLYKSKERSEIINALQLIARKNKPKDIPETWIQLKNKIVDIETGEQFAATPEYFNCNPLPYSIGESEETPTFDKIFNDWVGENKAIDLYEILAFCMIPDYFISRIFFLFGSGSNGKSCFLRILKKFIGTSNSCSTELDAITERFGTAALFKKLVCVIGETDYKQLNKTNILKNLSGKDDIDFEFKGKDRFTGVNYAKLIIATNSLPITRDKTDGFFRRMIIIMFVNKFSEKRDIVSEIPEEEYNNLTLKCLNILKRLYKEREFTNKTTIEERKKKYEETSNPLSKFIEENCDINPNKEIPAFEFFEKYNLFLTERGYRKLTYNEITPLMSDEGYKSQTIGVYVEGERKQWKHYIGLGWKTVIGVKGVKAIPTQSLIYRNQVESGLTALTGITVAEKVLNFLENEQTPVSFEKISQETKVSEKDLEKELDILCKNGEVTEQYSGFYKRL